MMKKFLVFAVMLSLVIPMVLGVSTSTFLESKNDGSAMLSSLHDTSPDYSARLHAWNPSAGNEGRVRITLSDTFTLNDITSISWQQYVEQGYIAHVDVILDLNDNGVYDSGIDDALVFEYAKVDPTIGCDEGIGNYPTGGPINTFGNKGIVDNDTKAWLTSANPGPGCDLNVGAGFYIHTLEGWKNGPDSSEANGKTINGSSRVLALEIEVDAWIAESEAFIDDIMLNGELIEDFEGSQGAEGEITADMTFLANPNPLSFGSLLPGQSKEVTSILSVGNSDLTVQGVDVSSAGTLFTEDNVMFSEDGGVNFDIADDTGPINIPAQQSFDLIVQLNVPVGTTSGAFAGTITYTIVETP